MFLPPDTREAFGVGRIPLLWIALLVRTRKSVMMCVPLPDLFGPLKQALL
jgi:hypothetical protein